MLNLSVGYHTTMLMCVTVLRSIQIIFFEHKLQKHEDRDRQDGWFVP